MPAIVDFEPPPSGRWQGARNHAIACPPTAEGGTEDTVHRAGLSRGSRGFGRVGGAGPEVRELQ